MKIEIINQPYQCTITGLGSFAINKDYVGTAFKLSGKVWEIVKTNTLKNKGQNIWVYGDSDQVFAGVELEEATSAEIYGLSKLEIVLPQYAYYKHIGPYHQIKQAGQAMRSFILSKGFPIAAPYIEVYGHWTPDETKLETELLMNLK